MARPNRLDRAGRRRGGEQSAGVLNGLYHSSMVPASKSTMVRLAHTIWEECNVIATPRIIVINLLYLTFIFLSSKKLLFSQHHRTEAEQ